MMLSVILVAAAAALFFGVDAAKVRAALDWLRGHISVKHIAAAVLLMAAIVLMPWGSGEAEPDAVPSGPLVLVGQFVGPSASNDAATVAGLTQELADEIEWDGTLSQPLFSTGVAVDDLRRRARELRCRGQSIGERQPAARDLIAAYLESKVGTSGGPLTPEQRSAWVSTLRDIGKAADDASR